MKRSKSRNPGDELVIRVEPLTVDRWGDFETLFGPRGACGGCWCMLWRLKRSVFEQQKGAENRAAMQALVASGEIPGLLAYVNGEAVGWCAVARRESYPALERSRILKRFDDLPVWSISCLFVAKAYRNRGISVHLLKAACKHVQQQGGSIVEGYPVVPKKNPMPAVFAWTGLASAFLHAGFVEVARHSLTRPIMRFALPVMATRTPKATRRQ